VAGLLLSASRQTLQSLFPATTEGNELMTEIIKLADEIVEHDEPHQAKPTTFEHCKKKWKESKRELEPA
jgi:hypothetical protein